MVYNMEFNAVVDVTYVEIRLFQMHKFSGFMQTTTPLCASRLSLLFFQLLSACSLAWQSGL